MAILLRQHGSQRCLRAWPAGPESLDRVALLGRDQLSTVLDNSHSPACGPPLQAATVAEAFQRVVAAYPDRPALRTLASESSLTWAELGSEVRRLASGLAAQGIGPGDTVAMLLPNTPECHMLDYAALHLGAVPFAIFLSSSAEQIAAQLERSDAKMIIAEPTALPRVRDAVRATSHAVSMVAVDPVADPDVLDLDDLRGSGQPEFDFESAWRAVKPDDLLTIIFTSGTTGPPKAAQWSHRTVMEAQRAMDAGIPVTRESVVSFLPLAHAGGRLTCHYMALSYGSTITACPNMADAAVHIADAHPDALLSVPRVFEKLQVAIETMVDALDPEPRNVAQRALAAGRRLARCSDVALDEDVEPIERQLLVEEQQTGIAVLAPILARLGLDRLRSAIVGGAPAASELIYFFRAVGVPLMEAYGLSEAALPVFNRVDSYKTGTAGLPLTGVELRLGADNELFIKSSFNFVSYRNQPDATADAIDADGWLRTGDIAEIDAEGFVAIVDRKKELMISSAGKNMSPANIESAIRGEASLIGQVAAIGDGRKYVTALITFDAEAAVHTAKTLGLPEDDLHGLASNETVRRQIDEAVERGNARLSRSEQLKKYCLLPQTWSPDSDELTPTGKLKRRIIASKYAANIEDMYRD